MTMRDEATGRFITTHGESNKHLYKVWSVMKDRCVNAHNKRYRHYGGRGIHVCREWMDDYTVFRSWAYTSGYREGLTIERIDVNGNYEPANCRWATWAEQNRNYSRNHYLTYKGETLCLTDMANKYGVHPSTLYGRLRRGQTIEEALKPIIRRKEQWRSISAN